MGAVCTWHAHKCGPARVFVFFSWEASMLLPCAEVEWPSALLMCMYGLVFGPFAY